MCRVRAISTCVYAEINNLLHKFMLVWWRVFGVGDCAFVLTLGFNPTNWIHEIVDTLQGVYFSTASAYIHVWSSAHKPFFFFVLTHCLLYPLCLATCSVLNALPYLWLVTPRRGCLSGMDLLHMCWLVYLSDLSDIYGWHNRGLITQPSTCCDGVYKNNGNLCPGLVLLTILSLPTSEHLSLSGLFY